MDISGAYSEQFRGYACFPGRLFFPARFRRPVLLVYHTHVRIRSNPANEACFCLSPYTKAPFGVNLFTNSLGGWQHCRAGLWHSTGNPRGRGCNIIFSAKIISGDKDQGEFHNPPFSQSKHLKWRIRPPLRPVHPVPPSVTLFCSRVT